VSTSTPNSDKPTHPWAELSLLNGQVMRGSAKQAREYLATPEVTIAAKKEAIVDADGGRTSYAFKLNTAPDAIWRVIFEKKLEDLPTGINRSDLRVEFRDDTLFLLCMPSKLETKYAFVKESVARTNRDYQQEKQAVHQRVSREDAAKTQEQAAGKTKVEKVKERFAKLEL
jgi:hypothetical protein